MKAHAVLLSEEAMDRLRGCLAVVFDDGPVDEVEVEIVRAFGLEEPNPSRLQPLGFLTQAQADDLWKRIEREMRKL